LIVAKGSSIELVEDMMDAEAGGCDGGGGYGCYGRCDADAEDMGAAAADEIRLPRYPSRALLEAYRVR